MAWIPEILGTPTISQVINVMKEAEIDTLAMLWVNARVAYLLSVHRMMTMEVCYSIKQDPNSDGYDQVIFTQYVETIEPFSSHMVLVPIQENVSMSWCKPCGPKMAFCHRASLYKTCTQS